DRAPARVDAQGQLLRLGKGMAEELDEQLDDVRESVLLVIEDHDIVRRQAARVLLRGDFGLDDGTGRLLLAGHCAMLPWGDDASPDVSSLVYTGSLRRTKRIRGFSTEPRPTRRGARCQE